MPLIHRRAQPALTLRTTCLRSARCGHALDHTPNEQNSHRASQVKDERYYFSIKEQAGKSAKEIKLSFEIENLLRKSFLI